MNYSGAFFVFRVDKHFCAVDRESLGDIANVYNYQAFVETDKAGYIIRQWIASNLYDRIRYVVNFLCIVLLIDVFCKYSTFLEHD